MMQPYTLLPEMLWKIDPAVEAARKLPTWVAFHRACGRENLFFDNIERDGRRGAYTATAFTLNGPDKRTFKLADGRGKTPVAALEAAYRGSGRTVAEAEPLLRAMVDGPAASAVVGEVDPFEELFG